MNLDFGSVGKEFACNAGDLGLIPRLGRSLTEGSLREGNGNPLQYSDLENSMNCIVSGVTKSQTQLSYFHSLQIGWNFLSFPWERSDKEYSHESWDRNQMCMNGGKPMGWTAADTSSHHPILILPFFSTTRILILSHQSASFKNDHFPASLAAQGSHVTKLGQWSGRES